MFYRTTSFLSFHGESDHRGYWSEGCLPFLSIEIKHKYDVRANANAGEEATDPEVLRIGVGGENSCSKQDEGSVFRLCS